MALWIKQSKSQQPSGGGSGSCKSGKLKTGHISDETLFMFEKDLGMHKGTQILEKGLTYNPESLEDPKDDFYCLFNHSIKETAEIFAEGGMTKTQLEEYLAMYNIDINTQHIRERLDLIRKATAMDYGREWRPNVVGQVVVPKMLIGIPMQMTSEKKIEKPMPQLELLVDISYNCGNDAQQIIQTMVCMAAILQNIFEDNPGFVLKAVNGTQLRLTDQQYEELILWGTQVIKHGSGVYDWIHYFLPMHTRGLEFVWHANMHEEYDIPEQLSTDFKEKGMGRPYPQSNTYPKEEGKAPLYTIEEMYANDPKLGAFDEEIRKNMNTDIIVVKLADVSAYYNSFEEDEDVRKFINDVNEKVANIETLKKELQFKRIK